MKIIHYADIQVKNRNENLFISTNKALRQIETIIEEEQAEILIIAGDLFEYATPNESERKLIYNHLSRLLNIKTVKELVVFAGNHDLIKEKKQIDSNIGYNAISVFSDMIEELDVTLSSKLSYFSESGIYESKVTKNINYVVYSLEDNGTPDIRLVDPGKLNICLFHAMLKEYVDSVKLPLRKDVIDSLVSIESFPFGSLITAGDIHKNLTFEGLNDQVFIYPGSPIQHTHSEGNYITFGNEVELKQAEFKVLKQYVFDDMKEITLLSDIKVEELLIDEFIVYNTITLDPKIPYEIIKHHLENTNQIAFGIEQTFIKVKSATVFISNEMELFNLLNDCAKRRSAKRCRIEFEYDKFQQNDTSSSDNKIIQEIIEEKSLELKQNNKESNEDQILSSENIDDLILNTEQLNKLFSSTLDNLLENTKNVFDSDVTEDSVKERIMSLFAEELQNTTEKSSKRYYITLEGIETNGFMTLAANRIDLAIPGMIRILGTNGIGKTTLYNMIRWNILGEVFSGMSKTQVVKNNLIVFNKNQIENDCVLTRLNCNINELKIIVTRSVVRKWKNNTTNEQKAQQTPIAGDTK